ncbi:hypothetical protein COCON_G00234210 [Conger conger]|uniref:Uncharacterized protein n=1 Tax=Conger conger TaxID=82655 RepID=A0A9Q1CTA3_CONCO|nr:hypothetical protein COCON_G00234210 [Conger conger]
MLLLFVYLTPFVQGGPWQTTLRTTIVAQGGGKALIPLALEGTEAGKIRASHVLAKIAAVSNPEMAFPGERIYEVVRPLVSLLHPDRDGIQNYEALMSLTNLAGLNDKLRVKILKEKALPDIENYMFEEHDQIRQAATECMCNLVVCKEVQERYMEDGNDKLKLLVLLCSEDDDKLQRAAAGALAMLTAAQKKLCTKITLVVFTKHRQSRLPDLLTSKTFQNLVSGQLSCAPNHYAVHVGRAAWENRSSLRPSQEQEVQGEKSEAVGYPVPEIGWRRKPAHPAALQDQGCRPLI